MEKNSVISKTRQLITLGIVPTILAACLVLASLFYYGEVSYSTLQYQHSVSAVQFPKGNELIPGDIIHGEFTARDNNLGALGIKITTFNRINNTAIAFRFREKGKKEWYCYNTYFTDRFPNKELYPFGFPVIRDSAGKTYEFEILAGNGRTGNAIGILRNAKFFVSRYTFDKRELFSNKQLLIEYLEKKVINLFTNTRYLIFLSMFFIPLILYISIIQGWITTLKNKNKFNYQYLFILFIVSVYVFYPVLMKTDIILFISLLILVISSIYRIPSQRLFAFAAVLICLCPLWLFIHQEEMANRSSMLVFFFTLNGLLLITKELFFNKK